MLTLSISLLGTMTVPQFYMHPHRHRSSLSLNGGY